MPAARAASRDDPHLSGDAYLNEDCSLLVCDPIPGVDDDMEHLLLFTDFMTFLAPVAPAASHRAGSRVFNRIGCNDCHTRTLTTGANANPALDRVTFHPFSDFLLHDIGQLGDGVAQGDAGPTEMRTAPLWGLRFTSSLLHDGRIRLKRNHRAALLRFLGAL